MERNGKRLYTYAFCQGSTEYRHLYSQIRVVGPRLRQRPAIHSIRTKSVGP